jgi:hypothetical protein
MFLSDLYLSIEGVNLGLMCDKVNDTQDSLVICIIDFSKKQACFSG